MATITRENIGLLTDKITVNLTKEDYLPNFDKTVKQFSKNANLPGFRKGMVPPGLIRKMHGPALFTDEVLKSVEKELGQYLQQEKLEIFAQPLSMESLPKQFDPEQPGDYAFDFEIGLKPGFEIPSLKDQALTRYRITVTGPMVEEEMDRLQMKGGKMTEPEAITTDDNVVNAVFEECDEQGNPVENGIRKDNSLLLKYFSPAIREQLMGKKKDDSIVFPLSGSFDAEKLEWVLEDLGFAKDDADAARKYFRLTITKVGLLEKRALEEAFFNEVYPGMDIHTEEDFRNKVKSEIEHYYEHESRHRLDDDIFEILVHHTAMDLPVSFLKRWMQNGGEKKKTAGEVEKEYPQFDHQLRWTLISDKLIRENGLSVSVDEMKENIRQKIRSYYGGGIAGAGDDWLEAYADKMIRDEKYTEQLYREMINAKLFGWLESQVNPLEMELPADEFIKLPHKHHHHEQE